MALKRTFMIGVTLVCGMLTGVAWGQNHTPGTFFERTPEASKGLPLATPGVFDYDAQLFAPLEFTNGKEKAPNTGFYFDLAKTYTSIERATRFDAFRNEQTSNGSEYLSGTRYELGWYNDSDKGWNAVYGKTEGSFQANSVSGAFGIQPLLGSIELSTFELNRTFRQALSSGGVFEPFVGLRYNWMRDATVDNSPDTLGQPSVFRQTASNSAVGIQVGAKVSKRRGRWRFSYKGNAAATYNQQRLELDDTVNGGAVLLFTNSTITDQSFVPIIDGLAEINYSVTRDISLKLGVQGSYIWNGILRANTETTVGNSSSASSPVGTPAFTAFDESYVAVGFVYGFEWRR